MGGYGTVRLAGLPERVTICEVGPRDGLQNEPVVLPASVKVELIERLVAAGHTVVESTSFVHPKWVPQLADAEAVLAGVRRVEGVRYPVLVPNERGLDRALRLGATDIAVFGSATDSFAARNLNRTLASQLEMFQPVVARARQAGLTVRAYLSMCFGDPWEGRVAPSTVAAVGRRLLDLGCWQLSLGDTIGVGTAGQVDAVLDAFAARGVAADSDRLAVHFHDTYGQALANAHAAMRRGVRIFDTSTGGIGGSPFASMAGGNLATEDLLWLCRGAGIATGVELDAIVATARWLASELGHELPAHVSRASRADA
jgi:hydroxymethylglutaryl-CoA lyase